MLNDVYTDVYAAILRSGETFKMLGLNKVSLHIELGLDDWNAFRRKVETDCIEDICQTDPVTWITLNIGDGGHSVRLAGTKSN